jgi:hypothetical protein
MSEAVTDIRNSFVSAQAAQEAYCMALTEFQTACVLGDNRAAEHARERVLACAESFMDHFAAAHRRMRDKT